MKRMDYYKISLALVIGISFVIGYTTLADESEAIPPVADAGSSRYAGPDQVMLDGTGSYDPDNFSLLSYSWRQISGPDVEIIDANTATPTIDGFIQTNEIQECEFELLVSDGELTSLPDSVTIIIVPNFGPSTLRLENASFDPNKPTIIYFGGGDCINGYSGQPWNGGSAWMNRANVIGFPSGYTPDSGSTEQTYYRYGDMIIVYLSSVAPEYKQPIQTIGWSTGGMPAMDVGIHLNRVYKDARYAVNHVTHLEAPCLFLNYSWDVHLQTIDMFLTSSVDGEQCWLDEYYGTESSKPEYQKYLPYRTGDFLLVYLKVAHNQVRDWYRNSITSNDMNKFNSGVVAGAYWSVVGPGKNLRLARSDAYYFEWDGGVQSGSMDFYDETQYPGRLPEPVTLMGPPDGTVLDANGVVLSCEVSENAVGYQLLFGSEPYKVMDYTIASDTPEPPSELITELPFVKTYWTVRVYDEFGSTIYADPLCIYAGDPNTPAGDESVPDVAFIYSHKSDEAQSFQSLLESSGCPTTLIKSGDFADTPLDSFDIIIVADDTQSEETWTEPNAIAAIENSGKPIIGLGDGGYDFFGLLGLSIGNPFGGHTSKNSIKVVDPNRSLFSTPYSIEIPEDRVLQLYTDTDSIGIYFWPTVPETITVFGNEVDDVGYFPLVMEDNRYFLWGFTESPEKMTETGKKLFINTVVWLANAGWENEN